MIPYLYPVTLSIIIVNYNVKLLLEQCLSSVEKAAANLSHEIFVVDNASTDGSMEYVVSRFPKCTFIRNAQNAGFAKANNQALALATGEFILFLNPDTILPELSLVRCISFFQHTPEAGALGVRMIDGDGNYLRESKRGLPTPANSFWKLTGFTGLFPRSALFSSYYAAHVGELTTHPVEVLSGGFMMIRKKVLDEIGGFDERFFMYAEDIDLSLRVMKAGYKNYYFPEVTIVHLKGSSTKKDIRYVRQFYFAMKQYVHKHYGKGLYSALLNVGIMARGALAALINLFSSRHK